MRNAIVRLRHLGVWTTLYLYVTNYVYIAFTKYVMSNLS